MNERQPIRGRVLVLRILVPGLETRLRDKIKEREDRHASTMKGGSGGIGGASSSRMGSSGGGGNNSSSNSNSSKETLLDLDGVTCEPTQEGSTLWNFHCDGATYPARLVNLPCPIELHKTHDHVMYYKTSDVAQMLIVFEDSMALDESDAIPKVDGYPSYYHSGLTPPMRRVVERKFSQREHRAIPPPRAEVSDVESEMLELMQKISKEAGKRNKVPSLATAQSANKVLEEVVEEVVDYEPWMDEHGNQAAGITIDAEDELVSKHPELWIEADAIKTMREDEIAREEAERKKKEAAAAKKESKRRKKEKKNIEAAAAAAAPSTKKKVNASKPPRTEPMDDITYAASMMETEDLANMVDDTFLSEFNFDDDDEFNLM